MKKKKTALTVVIIICVIVVVASVLYFRPVHVAKQIDVYNDNNEKMTLSVDVTWRNRLFNPNRLTGTVSVNGTEYTDCFDLTDSYDFMDKIKGNGCTYVFSAGSENISDMMKESIMFLNVDRGFNKVELLYQAEGTSIFYSTLNR